MDSCACVCGFARGCVWTVEEQLEDLARSGDVSLAKFLLRGSKLEPEEKVRLPLLLMHAVVRMCVCVGGRVG